MASCTDVLYANIAKGRSWSQPSLVSAYALMWYINTACLLARDPFDFGLYPEVSICFTPKMFDNFLSKLLIKLYPLSVSIALGAPYCENKCFAFA